MLGVCRGVAPVDKQYYLKNKEKWREYHERAKAKPGYVESHRKSNREYMRRTRPDKKKNYDANRRFFLEYLGNCCAVCGYDEHPEILQFDHLDEAKKKQNFPCLFGRRDRAIPLMEVGNLALLCPNCHALKTLWSGRLSLGRKRVA